MFSPEIATWQAWILMFGGSLVLPRNKSFLLLPVQFFFGLEQSIGSVIVTTNANLSPETFFLAAYLKLRSFYVHCFHPSFRSDCYTRVYSKFYVIHPSFIWGFPKIGVPIFDGMFPYKPYFLRYLHLWKPPYPVFIPLHLVTSFSWMV